MRNHNNRFHVQSNMVTPHVRPITHSVHIYTQFYNNLYYFKYEQVNSHVMYTIFYYQGSEILINF